MRPYLGYVCILMAALCWGLLGPVSRFALEANLSPLEVAFWRCTIGGIFFFIHAAASNALKIQSIADGLSFALFGAFAVGGFFASYQYSVRTGGAAMASVLLYTAPAWVAIFSRVLLGEHLSKSKIAAICMALAGVYFISVSGQGDNSSSAVLPINADRATGFNITGLIFGLLAGLLYSMHYIFTTRFLKRYTAFTLYGYLMLFGALALLPFIDFALKAPLDWLPLIFLGLICTYGAYLFYCEGLRRLAPTRAAILATFEPVIATFAAWWIWGESFAPLGWAGSALIIGAVLCLILIPNRENGS